MGVLDTEIKFLAGIGPKRAELLEKELGISTFRDMLYFFPFRYIDRSKVYTIRELQPTMAYIQVRGKIVSAAMAGDSPKSKRFVAVLQDPTGRIELVFFKGVKWIQEKIKSNLEYAGSELEKLLSGEGDKGEEKPKAKKGRKPKEE